MKRCTIFIFLLFLAVGAFSLSVPQAHASVNCGETSEGAGTDSGNAGWTFATPCVTGSNSGGYTVASIYYYVGNTATTDFQLGVYSDNANTPHNLLCSVDAGTITPAANNWNSVSISGCGTLSASTQYWVGYLTQSNTIQQQTMAGNCPGASLGSIFDNGGDGSLPNPFPAFNGGTACYSFYMVLNTSGGGCDSLATDLCSTDFFIRGETISIGGNSQSTDFGLQDNGQVLALPLMSSADFDITSGVIRPIFQPVKPAYNQVHYQWRNDNGSETSATSATGGIEDTTLSSVPQNSSIRLRMEITNDGGTIFSYSPQSFQLQYGAYNGGCTTSSISWITVGASNAVWGMYNSGNLTDGANTTNIATSTGGVLDTNHTFIVSNGGVKTTTSTVAAISVPSDSFIETEFDIQALSSSTLSGVYCFRLTNNGSASNFVYSQYPQATVVAGQSITLTLNTSTVNLPNLAPTIGVSATTTATVNISGASDGYTMSIQRNAASSTLEIPTAVTPTLIQTSTAVVYSGTTVNTTLTNTSTVGDMLMAGVSFDTNDGSGYVTSATSTCTTGNWTVINASSGVERDFAMLYAPVTSATSCTINLTYSANSSAALNVHEVSGINLSHPLDTSSTAAIAYGSSGSFTSGTSTTSVNGDYIFGFANDPYGVGIGPGTGFTLETTQNGDGHVTEDMIQSVAGPVSASFTYSGTAGFSVGMMAFEPITGASTTVLFPDYTPWTPSGTACSSGVGNATKTPGYDFSFRVASSGTTANYCSLWWGNSDVAGTAQYAGVPTSTQPIVYSTSSASQNGTTTVSIMYSANAPVTQQIGNYTGSVTITVLANP